jgi:hypothetical protein
MTTPMTTSRAALGGLLALAVLPAFWPGDAAAHTCDAPFRTDLVTGRGIDVGQVTVCNDAEFLTVTYETTYPWCVLRTHLHVASELAGIPKFRLLRTPNWLRFDFIEDVDCEGEVTFDIALDEIDRGVLPGDSVVVAARAVVEGEGADGIHPRCLLGDRCIAWGKGSRFRPRLPAMYFTYKVQEEAVPCPAACVTGLNVLAGGVEGRVGLRRVACGFDTFREAGAVFVDYVTEGPPARVEVEEGRCHVFWEDAALVDIALSAAEQASCAPLAVDILPLVDETNCDISPP